MIVTADTNILYQALRSNRGAAYFIVQRIRSREIQLALSVPVFAEYQEVLTRDDSLKQFGFSLTEVEKFLRFIAYVGKPYETYFLFRPNLQDETDNMFVELALASQSDYLITSNIRDFQQAELKFESLRIMTPAEFVKLWRKKYGES